MTSENVQNDRRKRKIAGTIQDSFDAGIRQSDNC